MDFKHARRGAYKGGGLIDLLKIFNSKLNICCLKIENNIHIA